MAENFPNLTSENNSITWDARESLTKKNTKNITLKDITVKLLKTKDKILKTDLKNIHYTQGATIKLLIGNNESEKDNRITFFKLLKKKYSQHRTLRAEKISTKNKEEIKTF